MGKWLNEPKDLLFEVRDHVAYITLNRPDKRNAMGLPQAQEILAALMEADDLVDVRVVVLSGAGVDFCAGADVGGGPVNTVGEGYDPSLYRDRNSGIEDDIWLCELSSRMRLVIHDMHKPVIAKVHGNVLAAGLDLALNCDLVISSTDAKLGFPATRGLGSPTNHMWLYLVGPQWAKRMLMTGDVLTGADAARIGLVLEAYPADKLDEEVELLAKRLAIIPSDLQTTHKRIVNIGLELMGWNTMQRLAAENDGRAHQSSAYAKFFGDAQTLGFKEALRLRDEPYGDRTGDHRKDSVVKLNILGGNGQA
ncbi:MAG: crotonase/enoyl-CoA hydratase family protein [Sphingomonadales bacterium]|nr:MAG: crotonase/enoyl-CoA hydratase family protein [Sphingomonadales bacterium]